MKLSEPVSTQSDRTYVEVSRVVRVPSLERALEAELTFRGCWLIGCRGCENYVGLVGGGALTIFLPVPNPERKLRSDDLLET